MLIPIEVSTFAMDQNTNLPVVILKEISGNRTLLITLDQFEARTVALNSLEKSPALPHTINLTRTLVEKLGGKFEKVVLNEHRDGGLCAFLSMRCGKRQEQFLCRVCDGIAMALHCELPLLVPESLLIKASPDKTQTPAEKLRRSIMATDTLRFGEFIIE